MLATLFGGAAFASYFRLLESDFLIICRRSLAGIGDGIVSALNTLE